MLTLHERGSLIALRGPRRTVILGLFVVVAFILAAPVAAAQARIAFASGDANGKTCHIWTIAPDGSGLTRLTSGRGYDFAPAWSPDRRTIAFIRRASGDIYDDTRSVVMLMSADGTQQRRLRYTGPSPTSGTDLAFSPNGRYLAGGGSRGDTEWSLTVVDLKTHTSRAVYRADWGNGVRSVSWSPDGRHIVAAVEFGDGTAAYRFDLAGGEPSRTYGGVDSASWRPDGKYLLCCIYTRKPARPWVTRLLRPDGSYVDTLGQWQGDLNYSPSGGHYAFMQRARTSTPAVIKYADGDGSDVRSVYRAPAGWWLGYLAWQ